MDGRHYRLRQHQLDGKSHASIEFVTPTPKSAALKAIECANKMDTPVIITTEHWPEQFSLTVRPGDKFDDVIARIRLNDSNYAGMPRWWR